MFIFVVILLIASGFFSIWEIIKYKKQVIQDERYNNYVAYATKKEKLKGNSKVSKVKVQNKSKSNRIKKTNAKSK